MNPLPRGRMSTAGRRTQRPKTVGKVEKQGQTRVAIEIEMPEPQKVCRHFCSSRVFVRLGSSQVGAQEIYIGAIMSLVLCCLVALTLSEGF